MKLQLFAKMMLISAAIGCTAISLQSCHKKKDDTTKATATYDFSSTGSTIIGGEVTFQSTAPSGSTLQWDFGDGGTSTQATPVHIYSRSDSFTVTLSVNKGPTTSKSIYISPLPDSSILARIAGDKFWHGYVIGHFQSATAKDTITSGLTDEFAITVVNSSTISVKGNNLSCYFVDLANHAYYFRYYLAAYSWREVDYFYNSGNIHYVYYPDQGGDPTSGPYSFATVLWNP